MSAPNARPLLLPCYTVSADAARDGAPSRGVHPCTTLANPAPTQSSSGVAGQGSMDAKRAAGCKTALDLIASQNPMLPMHPVFQEVLNSPNLKGTLFVPTARAWCAAAASAAQRSGRHARQRRLRGALRPCASIRCEQQQLPAAGRQQRAPFAQSDAGAPALHASCRCRRPSSTGRTFLRPCASATATPRRPPWSLATARCGRGAAACCRRALREGRGIDRRPAHRRGRRQEPLAAAAQPRRTQHCCPRQQLPLWGDSHAHAYPNTCPPTPNCHSTPTRR